MSLATSPGALSEEESQLESYPNTPIINNDEDATPDSNGLEPETASLASESNIDGDLYPDSPPSPSESEDDSHCSSYLVNERIPCTNNPSSKLSALLQSRPLWSRFDAIGTEMIVTRRGRRMFPPVKVELYDLKPDAYYVLLMDMAPVDNYRYKYQNSAWVKCFEEECSPTRLYVHPDSPALGSHWLNMTISFYKLKLTNNQLDKQGHIIVNSMHRYQPRLHVAEASDIHNLNWEKINTFVFPGTQFTTVTAYQNDKITQLKIENNPFAKGFRTPFSRCRAPRNQQMIAIRPASESSSEGIRSPSNGTLMSPHIVLPMANNEDKHIYTLVGHKRRFDMSNEHTMKHICVSAPPHTTDPAAMIKTSPQIITTSAVGTQKPQSPPIYIVYNPTVIQQQGGGGQQIQQVPLKNGRSNGSTPMPMRMVCNGQLVNGHTIIQAEQSPVPLNGTTLIQQQIMTSPKLKKVNGINGISGQNGVNLIQPGQPTLIQTSNGTIIQANPMLLPHQSILNGGGIVPFTGDQLAPTTTTTTSPATIIRQAPRSEIISRFNKSSSSIDISSLTRKRRHLSMNSNTPSPPPLVQVKPEKQDIEKCPSPPTPAFSIASPLNGLTTSTGRPGLYLPTGAANGGVQNLFLVANNSTKAGNTILVPVQSQGGTHTHGIHTAGAPGQTLIPVAYDQQILASMPFYRSPISTANTLQPIQIITPIQAAHN